MLSLQMVCVWINQMCQSLQLGNLPWSYDSHLNSEERSKVEQVPQLDLFYNRCYMKMEAVNSVGCLQLVY